LSSGRRLKLILASMVLSLAASAGDSATALRRLGPRRPPASLGCGFFR
jgi:hypothetical protein